jgi:hypothetical protein
MRVIRIPRPMRENAVATVLALALLSSTSVHARAPHVLIQTDTPAEVSTGRTSKNVSTVGTFSAAALDASRRRFGVRDASHLEQLGRSPGTAVILVDATDGAVVSFSYTFADQERTVASEFVRAAAFCAMIPVCAAVTPVGCLVLPFYELCTHPKTIQFVDELPHEGRRCLAGDPNRSCCDPICSGGLVVYKVCEAKSCCTGCAFAVPAFLMSDVPRAYASGVAPLPAWASDRPPVIAVNFADETVTVIGGGTISNVKFTRREGAAAHLGSAPTKTSPVESDGAESQGAQQGAQSPGAESSGAFNPETFSPETERAPNDSSEKTDVERSEGTAKPKGDAPSSLAPDHVSATEIRY